VLSFVFILHQFSRAAGSSDDDDDDDDGRDAITIVDNTKTTLLRHRLVNDICCAVDNKSETLLAALDKMLSSWT